MIYYYSLFTIFVVIVTMMIIDQNVSDYIVLLAKSAKLNVERMFWMIRFHPAILSSPIGRWWMMRKYMRTVKELSQELSQKEDEVL
jgi:hypothetical protein